MKAYVICINDSIEYVIIDDEEKANSKMKELSMKYYLKNQYVFSSLADYKNRCYWHIHSVDAEK